MSAFWKKQQAATYHYNSGCSIRLLSFAIHKDQSTHADLIALLDERIIESGTTPQQLTYEICLLDQTLKPSICKERGKTNK
jgi:hypothetical protein